MRNYYKNLITGFLLLLVTMVCNFNVQSATLSESFEGAIPDTWTVEGDPLWSLNAYGGYDGNDAVRLYKYGAYTDARLITPMLTVDATSTISYYAKNISAATGIQVQYSSDMVTWYDIGTEVALTSTYTQYTVDLSSLSGNYYIAFKGTTATTYAYNYAYIDLVVGPEIYVNPNPEIKLSESSHSFGTVTVSSTNTFDVTIENTGGSDLTFSGVTVSAPFSCPTPSTIASGASQVVTITYNPSSGGVHEETLTFNCNASNSEYTIDLSGAALSATAVTETFDSEIPDTWTTVNNNADSYEFKCPAQYGVGGTTAYAAAMGCSDDYLITPKLAVTASDNILSFKAGVESSSYKYSFRVKVSTTDTELTSFTTTLLDTANFGTTGWNSFILDLSAYNGQDIYVAFEMYFAGATYYSFGFDDITTPAYYVSADPQIAITPSSYDFGGVVKDATATTTITISNPGGADLTVSGITVASPFSATWSGTIAAGGTQDVTVSVSSSTAGSYTETLTVTSDASEGTNTIDFTAEVVAPLTYPLSEGFNGGTVPNYWTPNGWYAIASGAYEGTHSITTYTASDALYSPWIDLTGTSPRIAMYWKNTASKNLVIEVTEDGSSYTELFNSAPATADWEELIIDLATYVNKTVQFRFTSDANQSYSSTYIDDFKIEESPTDPIYAFNQTEFAFGTILLGETSTISASVTNAGVSTVDIKTITISGTDAADFSLSTLTLPVSIDNSSSLDFDVTFNATTEGAKTATLTVEEDNGTTHDYAITGTGFDAEIKTLPFTENFDATTVPALPAGWDKYIKPTAAAAVVETSTLNANSGANSAKLYGAFSVDSTVLILPVSSIDIATTILNFSLYSTSSGDIAVGYMTDKTDLSSFTTVSTISYLAYSRKACEIKYSDVGLTGNYYIAILNLSTGNSIYIDDINWAADETAPVATINPADSDIDINPFSQITFTFDEPIYKNGGSVLTGSDLASLINLNETDASGTAVNFTGEVDGNVITITPDARLSFSSVYYVSIIADAVQDAAGNLNILTEATFTTMDAPTTVAVPFTESFEGVDFVPTGWTENRTRWSKYDGSEIVYPDGVASAYYYAGAYDSKDSAEIVSPIIDISSLTDPNLLFDYADTNSVFTAFVSYDLGITYEELLTENSDDGWKTSNIKLVTGKEFAILKFKGFNIKWPLSSAKIFVDNISLAETPADPIFTITHTEHDFGTVLLTESDQIQIEVTNTGGQSITVDDVRLEGTNAADFTLGTLSLPAVITSNTLAIDLSFVPLTGGSKEATLVVEESDGTLHNVTLSGEGFDSEIHSIPFVENFDAVNVGEIPMGWKTILNTTSTSAYIEVSSNISANSQPNELRLYGGKAEGDIIAVLPFTNLDLTSSRLKFAGRGSAGCSIIVGTLTDPTDHTTFTEVDTVYPNTYSTVVYEADLSGITESGTYHIGLKHGDPDSYNLIYIDDLRITDNSSPEITSTPELNHHVGELYSYDIAATDANGDVLEFALIYGTDWLTLTDNGDGTANISGTPSTTGYKSIKVTVTDGEDFGEQSYTLTVSNHNPTFVSAPLTTAIVTEPYFYQVTGTDADNDALQFAAETLPDWLSFIDNGDGSAELSGTPDTVGNYVVGLSLTDGFASTTQVFSIEVADTNAKPIFESIPVTEVIEDSVYNYAVVTSDFNDDVLTIVAETKPAWLTLTSITDSTATLSGTSPESGTFNVNLFVTDGQDTTYQAFVINVLENQEAPVFTSIPVSKVTTGDTYDYTIAASDANNEAITIFAAIKPTWLTFTDNGNNTATLAGTAPEVGFYDVTLGATDGIDTTNQVFQVEVSAVPNTAPEFSSTPVLTGMEESLYTYTLTATDVDLTDVLSFTATEKPDWLTLVDNGDRTAVLSGTPTVAGTYDVVITLSDGAEFPTQEFQIVVAEKPNVEPVFASTPVTEAVEESVYTYNVSVTDEDADDVITITASTKPNWITFTDNGDRTAVLTGTPTIAGSYDVVLNVNDGEADVQQEFTIVVAEKPNVEPIFTSEPITEVDEGELYEYAIVATDEDSDDVLTITATSKPDWLSLSDNGDGTALFSGTAIPDGVYDIVINVNDGEADVQQEFTITVAPNQAPVFASTPPETGQVGQEYVYSMVVTDADGHPITFGIVEVPSWLTMDNSKEAGLIVGMPTQAGEFDVTIFATDLIDTTYQSWIIAIEAEENNVPVIQTEPIVSANVDSLYIYRIAAIDSDVDDEVAYGTEMLPDWLALATYDDGTAAIYGTPTQEGEFDVAFFATDGKDTARQVYSIDVTKINIAPVFTSIPDTTGKVGEEYIYNIVVNDSEGDVINITAEDLPTWLTLTDNGDGTAVLSGTTEDSDIYTIKLLASDGELNAEQEYTLNIKTTNIGDDLVQMVKVYPNPVVNKLNIEAEKLVSVTLYNITGESVYTKFISGDVQQIDVSVYPSGYYFVKIESEIGVVTKKIVIK